ncbi:hypothetical protein B0T19DRAFT_27797 [Cercophora scortea]|uniref:Uncharacterized protein n=1 Tax=Cercophora scortea TaxID=314031 RepID=A0AAE0J363_9PEZI|nr:hypothetical protein B0T19DRAFT_27797 [Cercophora scortea]
MFDLRNGGGLTHSRAGSFASLNPRQIASDANLRSRFDTNNGSSVSLAVPGPGFGSRPGTANGKTKPWVNPLDVHFARNSPDPPPQKSPLGQLDVESLVPSADDADARSIFGEEADDMVGTIMASVSKKEEEEMEKEKELEKQKVTAQLEAERLERKKATETKVVVKPPPPSPQPQPQPQQRPAGVPQQRPGGPPQQRPGHPPQQRPGHPQQQRPGPGPPPQQRPGHPQQQQQQQQQRPPNGPGPQGPIFRGNADSRPSSRGSMRGNGPPGPPGPPGSRQGPPNPGSRQGPPRQGPPQQGPPHHQGGPSYQGPPHQGPPHQGPPHQGPPRHASPHPGQNGQQGPPHPGAHQGPPRHAPPTHGLPHPPRQGGQSSRNQSPAGRGPPRLNTGGMPAIGRATGPDLSNARPYSPSPHSPGLRAPGPNETRSQSPLVNGPSGNGYGGAQGSGPKSQGSGSTQSSALGPADSEPSHFQSASSSGSILSTPVDDGPIEQFARPIIRNVAAKRDTYTMNSPRRHSLSMKIEELEKTLLIARAQQNQNQEQNQTPTHEGQRQSFDSNSSSNYSAGSDGASGMSDEDEDDEPILSTQPAPLRMTPSPAPLEIRGPFGSLRGGQKPRRPGLDEYGVVSNHIAHLPEAKTAAAPTAPAHEPTQEPAPAPIAPTRALSPIHPASEETHLKPHFTRSITPVFRHPNWTRDETSPVFSPTDARRAPPSPIVDVGFKFDFNTSTTQAEPPTPDSTTWPLAAASIPESSPPRSTLSPSPRAVPPRLTFDFSFDASSRDSGPQWTPPLRSSSSHNGAIDDGRPSTAQDMSYGDLAVPGTPNRPRTPVDDELAVAIGVARGLSVREPSSASHAERRAAKAKAMVDSFGTGFI